MSAYVVSKGYGFLRYPVELAERRQQVRALTRLGHSAADIAQRLGITNRTVHRYRAQDRARGRGGGRGDPAATTAA